MGTGRCDSPVALRDRAADERYGMRTPIALALDVEAPAEAFAFDDTFVPIRWKV